MSFCMSGDGITWWMRSLLPRYPRLYRDRFDAPRSREHIREALEFHLDGLREEGESLPEPKSYSRYINVATVG
jgi:hypothetical protein